MRFVTLGIGTLVILGLSVARAHGQAFGITYNFAGEPGNQANTIVDPGTVPAGMTSGPINRGSGITASAGMDSINSTGFTTGATVDINDYYQFLVTPNMGQQMTLTSLVFSERRSGTGIRNIAVRTSLDLFATDIFTATVPDDTLVRRQTVNFSGAFANLTSALEIRIYGYAAESAAGSWRLGTSGGADNPSGHPANLILNGSLSTTSAAPEPGTTLLALVGAGTFVVARRRRLP
jgi:hypothetical protein